MKWLVNCPCFKKIINELDIFSVNALCFNKYVGKRKAKK